MAVLYARWAPTLGTLNTVLPRISFTTLLVHTSGRVSNAKTRTHYGLRRSLVKGDWLPCRGLNIIFQIVSPSFAAPDPAFPRSRSIFHSETGIIKPPKDVMANNSELSSAPL